MTARDLTAARADASILESMLELARSAAEDPVADVLETVVHTLLRVARFRTIVLNEFRREWNHYEATLIIGEERIRETLLGSATEQQVLARLLADADRRVADVYLFFADDVSPVWDELDHIYTPALTASDAPDGWRADDALLVLLTDRDRTPLGFLSMDEPESGLRPTDAELQLLRMICSYAEQALRSARRAEESEADKGRLSRLGRISAALSGCGTRDELEALVADAIVDDFGFGRVAIHRVGTTPPHTARGWSGAEPARLRHDRLPASSQLMRAADLYDVPPPAGRNGRGTHAWSDQALVLPWPPDAWVVIDEPDSRLLPSEVHRHVLELLIDMATSVHRSIEQRLRLDHLAGHDALTGVRNRRGLDRAFGTGAPVALLLCDLDHFKRINDRHGHEVGDRVLARFGELLRELARAGDTPIRLGGEEFCLVLPNTDRAGALRAAERLRAATAARLTDLVPDGVTVSIGVALDDHGTLDARSLLKAADRRLYEAKRSGRDRTVA